MRGRVIKNKRLEILLSLVIVVICALNLWRLYGPLIVPDEVGYWATGYFFSGYNWSGVMGTSSYYGWGYGAVLAIICKIAPSPVFAFRVAIFMNAILLAGCYFLAIKVCKYVFPDISYVYRSWMCFAVTVYSGYIYYSQTTYCETLILFLYWLTLYLLMKVIEKKSYLHIILLAFVIAYLGAVHLRTILMLVAVILVLLILTIKKKINYKQLVVFSAICILLLLGIWGVKHYLSNTLYKTSTLLATNNVSGQIDKLSILFTWEGIKQFVGSFVGKILYAGTATFLLLYVSAFCCLDKVRKVYSKKKVSFSTYELIFIVFVFCGLIFEMLLSSYSLLTYGRIDHIIYGRYTEFLLGTIILYALGNIYIKFEKKILLLSIIAQFICSVFVFRFIVNKDYLGAPSAYTIPGLKGVYTPNGLDPKIQLTLYAGGISLTIFVIIYLMFHLKNKCIVLVVVSALWIGIALNCASTSLYAEQQYQEKDYLKFANGVENIVGSDDVFYIINDTEYVSWLKFKLKFFLPKTNMIAYESAEYDQVTSGDYLILYNNDMYYDEIMDTLGDKIYTSEFFTLYRKE